MKKKIIFTIAGFDPSSGAGVTADLTTISAHGMFGASCITALTVQSTLGVRGWRAVEAELVAQTLECLMDDLEPDGIKLGMLACREVVEAVAAFLARLPPQVPVVLDPVLQSSSGKPLLDAAASDTLRDSLLPRVDWITPNLSELAVLSGVAAGSKKEMEEAARRLSQTFPHLSIAATGGHLEVPDDALFLPRRPAVWLAGKRQHTRATHGTGCAFSSALLCGLVQGQEAVSAAVHAKRFVAEAMRSADPIGHGRGPMNLYWPLQQRQTAGGDA